MKSTSEDFRDMMRVTGAMIASLRNEKGLSQADLAEAAGVHTNTVANVENGFGDPSVTVLSLMLVRLGSPGIEFDESGMYPCPISQEEIPFSELQLTPPVIAFVIGGKIRERRIERGMSIRELAREADIHHNTVWNIENGLVTPSTFTIYRLYMALNACRVEASTEGIRIL